MLQVKVLELEKTLENERLRLGELRRQHYALAGIDYESAEGGKPTVARKPGSLKKPPVAQKPVQSLKPACEVRYTFSRRTRGVRGWRKQQPSHSSQAQKTS